MQSFIFEVQGGMYPKNYRETTIKVSADDIHIALKMVKAWAYVNFKNWNYIGVNYKLNTAEFNDPIIPIPLPRFTNRLK
ncbi:MAG: hypothetical protein LBE82_09800 [Chitinophagaceae bacterium]|jgi:hypothetical protein|nr:hypothetical protein [Chitinophagaceae bacterium]